jgi:hypothetical protein
LIWAHKPAISNKNLISGGMPMNRKKREVLKKHRIKAKKAKEKRKAARASASKSRSAGA